MYESKRFFIQPQTACTQFQREDLKEKRFAGPYDIALVRTRSQIVFVPGRIMPVGRSMITI